MSALPSVVMCPSGSYVTSVSVAFANWGNGQGGWMKNLQMACNNGMSYSLFSSPLYCVANCQAYVMVQSSTGKLSTSNCNNLSLIETLYSLVNYDVHRFSYMVVVHAFLD